MTTRSWLNRTTSHRVAVVRKWLGILSISRAIRWGMLFLLGWWVWNNWHNDLPAEQAVQRYAFPDSKFVWVDGMHIHYRATGKGTPVLLLHDAESSLHTWAGWAEKLSEKQQVLSVDLPGFGLSGPHPQGSYSAFMYASFLDSFLQKLNLKKVSLAGCGLGAQIAWQFAAESPQKVDNLILLDAPGFEEKSTSAVDWLASTPIVNRMLWKITPRYFVRLALEDVWADDALVGDSLVSRHFDLLLLPGHRKAFTDRASVRDNRPPIDLIERISAPTLILWGAEDTRISPEHAYDFHKRIRGALIKIYRNTGHWPQEENPVQTAQDVQAFLDGKF
ncbi:MAG: alpha/beta hydrolase [Saprospiraceae bacterium]|nr:alpha/beta hydrolase [Saprospiraceae bacterium]